MRLLQQARHAAQRIGKLRGILVLEFDDQAGKVAVRRRLKINQHGLASGGQRKNGQSVLRTIAHLSQPHGGEFAKDPHEMSGGEVQFDGQFGRHRREIEMKHARQEPGPSAGRSGLASELEQHAGFGQRVRALHQGLIKQPDQAGIEAVEATNLMDQGFARHADLFPETLHPDNSSIG
ncbi:hypothetical protein ACWGS9_23105 [Bradyrhizobium sp. Arg314]